MASMLVSGRPGGRGVYSLPQYEGLWLVSIRPIADCYTASCGMKDFDWSQSDQSQTAIQPHAEWRTLIGLNQTNRRLLYSLMWYEGLWLVSIRPIADCYTASCGMKDFDWSQSDQSQTAIQPHVVWRTLIGLNQTNRRLLYSLMWYEGLWLVSIRPIADCYTASCGMKDFDWSQSDQSWPCIQPTAVWILIGSQSDQSWPCIQPTAVRRTLIGSQSDQSWPCIQPTAVRRTLIGSQSDQCRSLLVILPIPAVIARQWRLRHHIHTIQGSISEELIGPLPRPCTKVSSLYNFALLADELPVSLLTLRGWPRLWCEESNHLPSSTVGQLVP